MNTSSFRMWVLIVAASVWPGFAFAQLAEINPAFNIDPNVVQVDTPGTNTTGLVVLGNQFAACHQGIPPNEDDVVVSRRVNNGPWEEWIRFKGIPGPIAWDNTNNGLWVVDSKKQVIALYTSPDKHPPRTKEIAIPRNAIRKLPSISGLTWDGHALWLVTDCGLCSTVFKIEPNTGKVLQSFFPKCIPRGLAYRSGKDPGGGELLMAAFTGQNKDALLSRREVLDDRGMVSEIPRYNEFLGVRGKASAPQDPTTIAIQGDRVWVVDRAAKSISTYKLPKTP